MMIRVIGWVVLTLLAGCAFKGEAPRSGTADGGAWRPEPTAVRVYPSTGFVTLGGDTLLEARIEVLDQMGDPAKASGVMRLELFAASASQASHLSGRRPPHLYVWRVPIRTIEQQERFYDPITRTYLLRLRLDNPAHAREPVLLRVTFLAADGSHLRAQAVVQPP